MEQAGIYRCGALNECYVKKGPCFFKVMKYKCVDSNRVCLFGTIRDNICFFPLLQNTSFADVFDGSIFVTKDMSIQDRNGRIIGIFDKIKDGNTIINTRERELMNKTNSKSLLEYIHFKMTHPEFNGEVFVQDFYERVRDKLEVYILMKNLTSVKSSHDGCLSFVSTVGSDDPFVLELTDRQLDQDSSIFKIVNLNRMMIGHSNHHVDEKTFIQKAVMNCTKIQQCDISQVTPLMDVVQETYGRDTVFHLRFGTTDVSVRLFQLTHDVQDGTIFDPEIYHNTRESGNSNIPNTLAIVAWKKDSSFYINFSNKIYKQELYNWVKGSNKFSEIIMKGKDVQYFGTGMSFEQFTCSDFMEFPRQRELLDVLNNKLHPVPVMCAGERLKVFVTHDKHNRFVTIYTKDMIHFTAKFIQSKVLEGHNKGNRSPLRDQIFRVYNTDFLKTFPIFPSNVEFVVCNQDKNMKWENILLCLRSKITFNPLVGSDAKLLFTNM